MSDEDASVRAWRVASRLEEFRGEERANLLRVLGVALFYAVELVNRYGLSLGPIELAQVEGVDEQFHAVITGVALAWIFVACAVLFGLRNRFFPPWLKYATTAGDLALATAVLGIADGPSSPFVAIYFPLLALASLRFSPALVVFATAGTIASYLAIAFYTALTREWLLVPFYHGVVVLLALGLVGLVLAHAMRRVHKIAGEYAMREPKRESRDE